MLKAVLLFIVCIFTFAGVANASGGGVPAGVATELTQVMNNLTLLDQSFRQVKQLYNQVKQVQYQLEQLKSLKKLDGSTYNKVVGTLGKLNSIAWQIEGVTYNAKRVDEAFRKIYKEYNPMTDYSEEYKVWDQETDLAIKKALTTAGVSKDSMKSEMTTLLEIQKLSDSAEGQTQAIQAGTLASIQIAQQLAKSRDLMADQIVAQATYYKKQNQEYKIQKESDKEFFQIIDKSKNKTIYYDAGDL